MKRIYSLFTLVACLWLTSSAMAQMPPPINNTNFGMVGIVRGQTLQLNLVAWPPGCPPEKTSGRLITGDRSVW